MKRPILAYGHSILRQKCSEVKTDYQRLDSLIDDMWETMHSANGCGLAAPQIGEKLRLFVVDSQTTYQNLDAADREGYFVDGDKGIMETFINAIIVERSAEMWEDEEGCLSIPKLSQTIKRPWRITIEYYNRNFDKQIRSFSGITARMIQHEYDHTEGILYLDYLKPISRKLLETKLRKISKGQISTEYSMKFIK